MTKEGAADPPFWLVTYYAPGRRLPHCRRNKVQRNGADWTDERTKNLRASATGPSVGKGVQDFPKKHRG